MGFINKIKMYFIKKWDRIQEIVNDIDLFRFVIVMIIGGYLSYFLEVWNIVEGVSALLLFLIAVEFLHTRLIQKDKERTLEKMFVMILMILSSYDLRTYGFFFACIIGVFLYNLKDFYLLIKLLLKKKVVK